MRKLLSLLLLAAGAVFPGEPLIGDSLIRNALTEISAENALAHTRVIAARLRYGNSQGFFDAAGYVARQASAYGLANVRTERFETDEPSWDAEAGELEINGRTWTLNSHPLLIAQHSADADLTAQVVEAGSKDVKGKIVLAPGDPKDVWRSAKGRGASAIICYPKGEYFGRKTLPDATLWSRAPSTAPVLMLSPNDGEALMAAVRSGETLTARVLIRARRARPGAIGMVMGEIPGKRKDRDIVLVAHLDEIGANDNASGCGALLEALRAFKKLHPGQPERTIRFWWSTEIRSEEEYFRRHPEEAKKILLAINLDEAGGDRGVANHMVMFQSPDWLPSYADDLFRWLAEEAGERYAPAVREPDPMALDSKGTDQPWLTVHWKDEPVSDHLAFQKRNVGIRCMSLAVTSLHVIHTSLDTMERLDPTWMKRSTFMVLVPAMWLSNAGPRETQAMLEETFRRGAGRIALAKDLDFQLKIERNRLESVRDLEPSIRVEPLRQRLEAVGQASRPTAKAR
ncbi:MAG: M28 family peptidase [Bryobacteraceae bacterium]